MSRGREARSTTPSSSAESSPSPSLSGSPSPSRSPSPVQQRRGPVNDFALAAFQTQESLEKLVHALKVYDRDLQCRYFTSVLNSDMPASQHVRVIPYEKHRGYQQKWDEMRLAVTDANADAPAAGSAGAGLRPASEAKIEEINESESEVETITQEVSVPEPPSQTQEVTSTPIDVQQQPMVQAEVETQTVSTSEAAPKNAKPAKRAKQKAARKRKVASGDAGVKSVAPPSSSEPVVKTPQPAHQSEPEPEPEPPLTPPSHHRGTIVDQVSPDDDQLIATPTDTATIHEDVHSSYELMDHAPVETKSDCDIIASSLDGKVGASIVEDGGSAKDEDGYVQVVDPKVLADTVAPTQEEQNEPVRPESVRTEMTLVLGEDDEDEGLDTGVSATSPTHSAYPPHLSPPTVSITPAPTENTITHRDSRTPPSDTIPVTISKRLSSSRSLSGVAFNFFSPDTSSPDSTGPPGLSLSGDNSSPESSTSPTEPTLVTPGVLQFGVFQQHEYPKSHPSAPYLPRRPGPQGSISVARSPLAIAPPINASAVATPMAQSLEPTRQNTPVSELSGSPPPLAPAIVINAVTPTGNVAMPSSVDKQDPATVHAAPLNYAYTLYSSNTKAKPATGGTPLSTSAAAAAYLHGGLGLGPAPSADTYSNELVPIFTAASFGEFFGCWKALRRKLAVAYNRPIEPEGSRQISPGTESLGLHLCPGVRTIHFFRQGIKPMWEDPMCGKGGKIMLTGRAEEVRP